MDHAEPLQLTSPCDARVLYLVRHADVEQDFAARFLGRTDPGLSTPGKARARLIRNRIQLDRGTAWTSPSRRAVETAALAFPGASLYVQPLALELDFGLLDGLLPAEAERLFPEAIRHIRRNPFDARPFGGEDWSDLSRRAAALCAALATANPLVLVSHRYFIRALVEQMTRGRVRDTVMDLAYGEVLTALAAPGGDWTVQRSQF